MKLLNIRLFRKKISIDIVTTLLTVFISIFIGTLWFLFFYSKYPLYFSNVHWIYNAGGDPFQHQLGWEWFRHTPWTFPIGKIEAYGYPAGTNLAYMDSIPLMAIIFKILSPLLGGHFQYLGLWELISIIGQMLIGMLIIGQFTKSLFQKIAGASLLVLSPVMLIGAFLHTTLSAQWVLLLALLFTIMEYKDRLWDGWWYILFAIAVLVHAYFVAMIVPFWAIGLYYKYRRQRKPIRLLIQVLIMVAMIGVLGYGIGLFDLKINSISSGYGYYSWNFNGFINPMEWTSVIMNGLPLGTSGQYEGYSYLGIGNLLLITIGLVLYLHKEHTPKKLGFFIPYIVISIGYIIFSLSIRGYINNEQLWEITLPSGIMELLSIFRASGRFIWPVFYLIVIFGIISVIRNVRYSGVILLLAVIIQVIDIQPLYSSRTPRELTYYQSPLKSDFWERAAPSMQHIMLLPIKDSDNIYQPFAILAVENGLTLNTGYFSRVDRGVISQVANEEMENLSAGVADKDTLYVFWGEKMQEEASTKFAKTLVLCEVDGFTTGLSPYSTLAESSEKFLSDCNFPSP